MSFFKTRMGRKLIEQDVPNFIRQLTRLNDNLERLTGHQETLDETLDEVGDWVGTIDDDDEDESADEVWVGASGEQVVFVCRSPEVARDMRSEFMDVTSLSCVVSGPYEIDGP